MATKLTSKTNTDLSRKKRKKIKRAESRESKTASLVGLMASQSFHQHLSGPLGAQYTAPVFMSSNETTDI